MTVRLKEVSNNNQLIVNTTIIGTFVLCQLHVRPSSFFSLFSIVWPTQIFGIFKKKSNDVVRPFPTWSNSFSLKNEHSNSIEKNRNKNRNIFYLILCISLIQILACEQALLFGRVKRVSREHASKRRSCEGQRPLARAFSQYSLRLPKQESLLAGYSNM